MIMGTKLTTDKNGYPTRDNLFTEAHSLVLDQGEKVEKNMDWIELELFVVEKGEAVTRLKRMADEMFKLADSIDNLARVISMNAMVAKKSK